MDENLKKAQEKYEHSDKGKARKRRYKAKPEVREREREAKRRWYEEQMTNPEFAAKEKERLKKLDRREYMLEYQRKRRLAKKLKPK